MTYVNLGFTLLELLVTMAISAILLMVAVPGFHDLYVTNTLVSETNGFVAALNTARGEAVRRGIRVTLRNTDGNKNCGDAWTMFVDTNGDGSQDTGEATLKRGGAVSGRVSFKSNAHFTDYIAFTSTGDSNNIGTFVLCYDNSLVKARAIIINFPGRIRTAIDADGDGTLDGESKQISCGS